MSHSHDHDPTVPKGALIGAAALILVVMAMTAAVTNGYIPKSGSPEISRAAMPIKESRKLFFTDTPEKGVIVTDADSGETVLEVPYGEGGYLRASLRRLVKARREVGLGPETPFTLNRWENGAMTLDDPATGKNIEVYGFGPDHTAMFASMFEGAES